jgi:type II secretory pathway pseudopilin PulG
MKKSRAFTIVELLLVVSLMAILLTMFVPTFSSVMRKGKDTLCLANLSGAGKGMSAYATEFNSYYPNRGFGPGTTRFDYMGASITTEVNDPPNAGQAANAAINSNSRNLYVAVRTGRVEARMFNCPLTTDKVAPATIGGGLCYDFSSSGNGFQRTLSYSYQLQFLTRKDVNGNVTGVGHPLRKTALTGMAILADRNPMFNYGDAVSGGYKASSVLAVPVSPTPFPVSPNHDNRGQNVVYVDGHGGLQTAVTAGVDGDNIYSAWNMTNPAKPDKATGTLNVDSMPQDDNDNLLVP